ncbi:MAG: hypothetical protein M3Q89_10935 [Verrucomicrobiota bacterium]|nr:hypothetical protein [Verrucomicrobiota bacterium]
MIDNKYTDRRRRLVTSEGSYDTPDSKTCQGKSDPDIDKVVALLKTYQGRHGTISSSEGEAIREQIYTALRRRLVRVCRRVAHEASEADIQDMAQEALLKFWRQDLRGRGIFDPAIPPTPRCLNGNIRGNIVHRYIDWSRRRTLESLQVRRESEGNAANDEHEESVLEYYAASQKQSEFETRCAVREVIAAVTEGRATAFTEALLEATLATGRCNSVALAQEHGLSQPTAWREVQALKRRFRRSLRREDLGPPERRSP